MDKKKKELTPRQEWMLLFLKQEIARIRKNIAFRKLTQDEAMTFFAVLIASSFSFVDGQEIEQMTGIGTRALYAIECLKKEENGQQE